MPIMFLQELNGLEKRLVKIGTNDITSHDITHVDIHIIHSFRWVNLKTLKHKADLWHQRAVACSNCLLFALHSQQPCIGVGRGDGIQVGIFVPDNIDWSWHGSDTSQ